MNPNWPYGPGTPNQSPPPQQSAYPPVGTPSQNELGTLPPMPGSAQPQNGHNPYEFIMNQGSVSRRSMIGGFGTGGSGLMRKLIVGVGIAVVATIVLAVVVSLLAPKGLPKAELITVAQRQQEVLRQASLCKTKAQTEDTKGYCSTILLTVGSNQSQVLTYLAKNRVKLESKDLTLLHEASTDTLLTNATATSTFDSAIRGTLKTQLTSYAKEIQTAYDLAGNTTLRKILKSSFTTASQLEQLN